MYIQDSLTRCFSYICLVYVTDGGPAINQHWIKILVKMLLGPIYCKLTIYICLFLSVKKYTMVIAIFLDARDMQ